MIRTIQMTAAEIIAILSGLSGLIIGLIAALSGARKDEILLLRQTLEGLTNENERIRKRLAELQKCIDDQDVVIDGLKEQVTEWKLKYQALDEEWKRKYRVLQSEFDAFKRTSGGSAK